MSSLSRTDWRTIVRRIRDGKVTPFISDRVSSQLLPGNDGLIQAWADDIAYPLGSSFSVTRLAQFLSVTTGDDLAAKEEFLAFSKRFLLDSVAAEHSKNEVVDALRQDTLFGIRFSKIASSLGYTTSGNGSADPLTLLAQLPLPIYITTSYYDFIEEALKAAGKEPRTAICYWREEFKAPAQTGLKMNPLTWVREILNERFSDEELRTLCYDLGVDYDDLPGMGRAAKARELVAYLERYQRLNDLIAVGQQQRPDIAWSAPGASASHSDPFQNELSLAGEQDLGYEPSWREPLVYHLHGLDTQPSSLVLTEDDYLDFLVKLSWDRSVVPPRIAEALADSSLLLLGYQLQDWDFRVLFRGLITRKRSSRRLLSLAIQLTPEDEGTEIIRSIDDAQDYLEKYFDSANFKIYWGEPQDFTRELWEYWTA